MKLWIAAIIPVLASVNLCGQGSVNFANNSSTPVYCNSPGGQRVPTGSTFLAELMYAPDQTPLAAFDSVAVRVGAPATFILPGIFLGGNRTIETITPAGGFGLFQVRVWETAGGASYREVVLRGDPRFHAGASGILRVDTGDPTTTPPGTSASLVIAGLTSFWIGPLGGGPPCIPEPSTVALTLLGLGALFVLPSKK